MPRIALISLIILVTPQGTPPPARLVREPGGRGDRLMIEGVGLPDGVMARPDEANPILRGKNLYAADVVRNGGAWNLYYGGWRDPADVNDRIYAAVAAGARPAGPWQGQQVIIDNGDYVHVNDPSVVRRGPDDWVMAFTAADKRDGHDWIAVATSRDGLTFSPRVATRDSEIAVAGAEFSHIGRPSLVWTGTAWKLWFDGRVRSGPCHCYLAESNEPIPKRFRLVHEYPDVGGFPGFFAPDVEKVGDRYVAVVQRQFTTFIKMESKDGVHFDELGLILSVTDPALGKKTISNPGWIAEGPGGHILGVAISMTDEANLTSESIGFAYHQLAVQVVSPPSMVHQYARSRGFDVTVPMTFGYREFSRIRVEDPRTHGTIAEFTTPARLGDRFRLVRDAGPVPPPPAPMPGGG